MSKIQTFILVKWKISFSSILLLLQYFLRISTPLPIVCVVCKTPGGTPIEMHSSATQVNAWVLQNKHNPHKPGFQHRVSETLAIQPQLNTFTGGGMTLSANHSSCILFINAFSSVLTLMGFWKADPHSWNGKGCCEAVTGSCCLFCVHRLGGKVYPNKENSLITNDTGLKKCSPPLDCQVSDAPDPGLWGWQAPAQTLHA